MQSLVKVLTSQARFPRVHLLAVFPTPEAMKEQCDSWLHYTAFRINRAIGEKGKFWQQEPFDHLVRSPEQYEYLRQYVADNPQKAGLRPAVRSNFSPRKCMGEGPCCLIAAIMNGASHEPLRVVMPGPPANQGLTGGHYSFTLCLE